MKVSKLIKAVVQFVQT